MKKTFLYTALALCLTVLTACNDFLTVEQKGKTTIPSFLSDPRGLHSGLVGAYQKYFNQYDNHFLKYPEVAGITANLSLTTGSDMTDQYNFVPNPVSGTTSYYIWYNLSIALANANNIIQYAPDVAKKYPEKATYCENQRAQALFLRAMCHFDLVRVFAQPYNYTTDASHLGVPVLTRTPGPNDNHSRNTVREVYNQILSDLKEAAGILNDHIATDYHYASLQAVHAMLSRVYLYMEDWQQAYDYAVKAIANQPLADGNALIEMYQDLNKQGEAIFRLSGQNRTGMQKAFYNTECVPTDQLLALFDGADVRLKLLKEAGKPKCLKYSALVIPDKKDNHEDPILFRLSEMYLTAAEAAWHLNKFEDARLYTSGIVKRAVGEANAAARLTNYTDATLINMIREERQKELCFEGHSLFDITRWKQNLVRDANSSSSVKELKYPSDLFILPIPQYELDANDKMLPNPTVNK